MIDMIKVLKIVWDYFPFLIALILIIDYEMDHEYDIEIKVKDVTFKNDKLFKRIWEFVTGEKLNE